MGMHQTARLVGCDYIAPQRRHQGIFPVRRAILHAVAFAEARERSHSKNGEIASPAARNDSWSVTLTRTLSLKGEGITALG